MTPRFVIAGTDTDVGKTVFAAALAGALDGDYWKPIQCGLEGGGDKEIVRRLSGLPNERILPEVYCFKLPASPHIAAEHDEIEIDPARLEPPASSRPLVIEGAGGLMVPITRDLLQIDLFARWKIPVILVARTALGTINHSLLSIEALNARAVPVFGIVFIGEENKAVQHTIVNQGRVNHVGRLPRIDPLDAAGVKSAFRDNFGVEYFFE
jgi:dethiobiotin synthetase